MKVPVARAGKPLIGGLRSADGFWEAALVRLSWSTAGSGWT